MFRDFLPTNDVLREVSELVLLSDHPCDAGEGAPGAAAGKVAQRAIASAGVGGA